MSFFCNLGTGSNFNQRSANLAFLVAHEWADVSGQSKACGAALCFGEQFAAGQRWINFLQIFPCFRLRKLRVRNPYQNGLDSGLGGRANSAPAVSAARSHECRPATYEEALPARSRFPLLDSPGCDRGGHSCDARRRGGEVRRSCA